MTDLRLSELRAANVERQRDFPGSSSWRLVHWSNALAGEVGEVCNLVKKVDRGDFGKVYVWGVLPGAADRPLSDEIADVLIYLDLLCLYARIDLADAVRQKFNRRSEEIGSAVRLEEPGHG